MRLRNLVGGTIILVLIAIITISIFAYYGYFQSPYELYQAAQSASPGRAVILYKRLGEKLPQIDEYIQLWISEINMPDQHALSILQTLVAFHPQSPAAYEAAIDIARYYADIDTYEAVGAYRSALALFESDALHLELALYLEKNQEYQQAYELYHQMLSEIPDAFEGMRRNGQDPLSSAEDLIAATYYNDALEMLRDVDSVDTIPLLAQALFGSGRYEEAEKAYREWLEKEPDDSDAQMGLARVLARLGRAEEAMELYQSVNTFDSRLALAGLLENEDPDQAVSIYLELPYPVAWWNATWIMEERGHADDAIPVYRRLAQSDSYFADDAAYRLHILGKKKGDQDLSTEGQDLIKELGPNWLMIRAAGGDFELSSTTFIDLAANGVLDKVTALESIGREDLAYLELIFAAKSLNDPVLKLTMLEGLISRGHFLEAQTIAESFVAFQPDVPIDFLRLSYPKPYAEIVLSIAEEYGIDPLLVWAMMRVESRYDPNAFSSAGARGLMQIIPSTQEWIAEQLNQETEPGDGYIPEKNLRMGIWYISYLLDYFEGDLELAILAYNGGASNVEQWLDDPLVSDREDLIRWIWFGETREYLERVMYTYRVYQELYGEDFDS